MLTRCAPPPTPFLLFPSPLVPAGTYRNSHGAVGQQWLSTRKNPHGVPFSEAKRNPLPYFRLLEERHVRLTTLEPPA